MSKFINCALTGRTGLIPIIYELAVKHGILSDLRSCFGLDIANKILSIVAYYLTEPKGLSINYTEFAKEYLLPYKELLSNAQLNELFAKLEKEPSKINDFFTKRAKGIEKDDLIVSFDSTITTNTDSYSLFNKIKKLDGNVTYDDKSVAQLGLTVSFNKRTYEPLFYRTFPGTIADSELRLSLMTDLSCFDLENQCLGVTEKDYKNIASIKKINDARLKCCMPLKLDDKWAIESVDKALLYIDDAKYRLDDTDVYALSMVKEVTDESSYQTVKLFIHVFLNNCAKLYEQKIFYKVLNDFEALWNLR